MTEEEVAVDFSEEQNEPTNIAEYSERIKNTVLILDNFKELADPSK